MGSWTGGGRVWTGRGLVGGVTGGLIGDRVVVTVGLWWLSKWATTHVGTPEGTHVGICGKWLSKWLQPRVGTYVGGGG